MTTLDILEIPYEERNYIYIVDNKEKFSMVLSATEKIPKFTSTATATIMAGILGGPIVATGVAATGLAVSKLNKRKKQDQNQSVYYAQRDEVYGALFPKDGIPLNHTLYICNPIDNRRYYTFQNFHQEMIDHKIYEAVYLLRSLGAIEINVLINEEANKNLDLNFSFEMFSSNNNFTTDHSSKIKYSASYHPSGKLPFIPDDIYWIDHESKWLHIANERIYNGLKSFELVVDISDNFGVNSELAAKIKVENVNINSNITGKYKGFKKTSLILSGKFSE